MHGEPACVALQYFSFGGGKYTKTATLFLITAGAKVTFTMGTATAVPGKAQRQ